MLLQNDICKVNIAMDDTYTLKSADNKRYDLELNPCHFTRNDSYKVFSITIDLFYKKQSIAFVCDFYSYDTDCALLEKNILTILSNDTIVQIDVIQGNIVSFRKLDESGCHFGIYKVKNGYIIYGEIEIIMLDFDFHKIWSFSGKDIFVSITDKQPIELCENSIKLYDFEDNFYEIDYDGNLISEE